MRAKDIMTPNPIGVPETATLWQALDAMTRAKVSALVVFDAGGAPIGVLSESDMLRRAELGTQKRRPGWLEFLIGGGPAAREFVHEHGRRVGEIMTRAIISIDEDAELPEAVDLMLGRRVKRLIVMREGKAVGVLSRSDVIRALMSALPRPSGNRPDAEIRADVEAAIDSQQWTPRGSVRVEVENGIVTLEGVIADDRLRGGLRVLCENAAGVTKVRDRLAWVEPNSGFVVPAESPAED